MGYLVGISHVINYEQNLPNTEPKERADFGEYIELDNTEFLNEGRWKLRLNAEILINMFMLTSIFLTQFENSFLNLTFFFLIVAKKPFKKFLNPTVTSVSSPDILRKRLQFWISKFFFFCKLEYNFKTISVLNHRTFL